MFGFSIEHLIILAIILILFGPKRLPELGNKLGQAMKNFKDALQGIEEASYRKVEEKPSLEEKKVSSADSPSSSEKSTAS